MAIKNGIAYEYNENEIHSRYEKKFITNKKNQQEIKNAQKIERFFRALKNRAKKANERKSLTNINTTIGDIVSDKIIEEILYDMTLINKERFWNYSISNIFQMRGGARFEQEIARVMEVIWNKVAKDENFMFDYNKVIVGTDTGNTLANIVSKDIEKAFKSYGDKITISASEVTNEINKLQAKQMKTDIQGYEIAIKGENEISKEYLKIYHLLKDATFSAKNYDSMSWDKDSKSFIENISLSKSSIHLGETNYYKAIYGVLKYLGFSTPFSIAYTFRGKNTHNENVKTHLYHLRFAYELTGAGLNLSNNAKIVKYLIYNDPHGDIYVRSVNQIISDLYDKIDKNKNNVYNGISINKTYFY